MANSQGWKVDFDSAIPITSFDADITEGQVLKLTGIATADVCGAGEVPVGVAYRDFSSGDSGEAIAKHVAVCYAAASITVNDLLKSAAAGQVTPVTADQDVIVGRALSTQTTVNGAVSVDLSLLGTYYAA
jgi:hypothetical protein